METDGVGDTTSGEVSSHLGKRACEWIELKHSTREVSGSSSRIEGREINDLTH